MRRPIVLSPALLKREISDKPLHFFGTYVISCN